VVADVDELEVDQMKLVRLGDRRIVLARTEKGYAAFDDRCTHRGGSLAGGVLMCGKVQCLWHGSQFDVHSGQPQCGPAQEPVRIYPVEEAEGQIRLLTGNL
jgi:nitrite reductase/ring-hydroxylating ferredoxin subunit